MEVSIKSENLELSDSMFRKLDELMNQNEMYTKFLLEKVDDMSFVSYTNVPVISSFLILISWPFSERFIHVRRMQLQMTMCKQLKGLM